MICKSCGFTNDSNALFCTKCGKKLDKTKERKHIGGSSSIPKKKKVIAIVIAATVLVLAFAGILIYKSVTEELDAQLINEEKSEYMVMNVPKNYTFRVSADTGEDNLEVVDIDGNHVRIEKKYENGEIKVKAPDNGYKEGKIYTLDASDVGTFRNKGIEGARAITFVVERDNTVNISYTDKVKDVESKQVVLKGNKLRIDGMYSDGDIVLVDTDNDNIQELYKLENVENNAGRTVADYEIPEGDEVYDDIDIFYYDKINMDDIVIDEDELIKNLDEFGILDLVFDGVYAAETPKGKLKVDVSKNGGKAECKFNIDVKMPNDNQKLTITFTVSDNVFYTADKKYVTFNNTLKLIGDIEFNVTGDNSKKKENNIKEAIKQYNTDTSGEKNPISDFEIPLIPVEIPLSPVTPVFLNCELGIKGYVKMDGNLNMGAKQTVTFTQGITINYRAMKTKKKYSNVDSTLNAHVDGSVKMNCYAGVYIEVGVTVPCLVTAGVDGSMGPYLDAEGYMSITEIPKEPKFNGFYDVDIGIKASSDVKIKALMFKEKTIPLIEQNKSLWHKSNKTDVESVNVKEKYYVVEGQIDIGKLNVTYKDVLTDEEEKLPMPKNYEVSIDETKYEVKDGVITGVDQGGKHKFEFKWKRDGIEYSFDKTVTFEKSFLYDIFDDNGNVLINTNEFAEMMEKYLNSKSAGGYSIEDGKLYYNGNYIAAAIEVNQNRDSAELFMDEYIYDYTDSDPDLVKETYMAVVMGENSRNKVRNNISQLESNLIRDIETYSLGTDGRTVMRIGDRTYFVRDSAEYISPKEYNVYEKFGNFTQYICVHWTKQDSQEMMDYYYDDSY